MEVLVSIELIEDGQHVVLAATRKRVFGGFFNAEQYEHVVSEVRGVAGGVIIDATAQLAEERKRAEVVVMEHELAQAERELRDTAERCNNIELNAAIENARMADNDTVLKVLLDVAAERGIKVLAPIPGDPDAVENAA
jgi:hypothetical protein